MSPATFRSITTVFTPRLRAFAYPLYRLQVRSFSVSSTVGHLFTRSFPRTYRPLLPRFTSLGRKYNANTWPNLTRNQHSRRYTERLSLIRIDDGAIHLAQPAPRVHRSPHQDLGRAQSQVPELCRCPTASGHHRHASRRQTNRRQSVENNTQRHRHGHQVRSSFGFLRLHLGCCLSSQGLAAATVIAKVNGELWDLERPFEKDSSLQLIKFDDDEGRVLSHLASASVHDGASFSRQASVLALHSAHHGRGDGAVLRRLPLLRTTDRARLLLRHVSREPVSGDAP